MKKFKSTYLVAIATVSLTAFVASCTTDPQSPGIEYMPDMYRSVAYEPYAGNLNYGDSMEARMPAEGSIAQGYLPYGIPNTNEGYELAGNSLRSPLANSEALIAEGKVVYTKFCVHCHGKEGKGDGATVTAGGHPPPPAYDSQTLKNLPEGKMFHTITYGKNLMGPHSSQLNVEERWKVIKYVQTLQGNDAPAEGSGEESVNEESTSEEAAPEAAANEETAMNN
ncbi:cytochrome c [bacterium]|nr:cytochrome c [bacterium]